MLPVLAMMWDGFQAVMPYALLSGTPVERARLLAWVLLAGFVAAGVFAGRSGAAGGVRRFAGGAGGVRRFAGGDGNVSAVAAVGGAGGVHAVAGGGGAGGVSAVAGGAVAMAMASKRMPKKDYIDHWSDDEDDVPPTVTTDFGSLAKQYCAAVDFVSSLKRRPYRQIRRQNHVEDLHIFNLPSNLSRRVMLEFYSSSKCYYKKTYPFSVPGMLADGTSVDIPMTPEKEKNVEERRHTIVCLERRTDKANAQILFEEYSGYLVAFRVRYVDDVDDIPWCVVGDEDLADRFKPWHKIKYKSHYTSLEKVRIDEGTGDKIFKFFETFRKNPFQITSAKGHLILDTAYVLFAEGRRFDAVAVWATSSWGLIPNGYPELIRHWSKLSKCSFQLYLYLLEIGLSMNADKSREKVIELWDKNQNDLESVLDFYRRGVELDYNLLHKLAGGELLLMKSDEKLWDIILLRVAGYDGPLMEEILME